MGSPYGERPGCGERPEAKEGLRAGSSMIYLCLGPLAGELEVRSEKQYIRNWLNKPGFRTCGYRQNSTLTPNDPCPCVESVTMMESHSCDYAILCNMAKV